ncbi:DUF2190 family protein [Halomonas salina]|uniref:Recombinase RecA n=1 Tax=Halomonas salina TaxID=42565 RepID=A0ABR4WU56_9GAMM|nr:capsid cement protein [Halomonas salina]KGE78269.1 hypothetical protein FP66_04550 [Halomonas salina]
MATNYHQDGQTIHYQNDTGSDIASGAPVVVGGLLCVAIVDIANGASGTLIAEGVASIPKATGSAINQGAAVDFDVSAGNANGNLTPDTGDLTGCGVAWETAASGDTTVLVKLNARAATVN